MFQIETTAHVHARWIPKSGQPRIVSLTPIRGEDRRYAPILRSLRKQEGDAVYRCAAKMQEGDIVEIRGTARRVTAAQELPEEGTPFALRTWKNAATDYYLITLSKTDFKKGQEGNWSE